MRGITVAVMQPYFLPYIGYFQLMAAADLFILYDNIKYTKKGWINRNRMLRDGKDVMFSLPLKSDSDSLDIRERSLAADFNREKLLNQFKGAYAQAPYYAETFALIEKIVRYPESNLFNFLHHSIIETSRHLGIGTELRVSSSLEIDHGLKGQDKVLAVCKAVGAGRYINAIGGLELYSRDAFRDKGIELKFIRPRPYEYTQLDHGFVPWLSIADVMMFNATDGIRTSINSNYELI